MILLLHVRGRLLTRAYMLCLLIASESAKELLILAILLRVQQFGRPGTVQRHVCSVCLATVLVAPSALIMVTLVMLQPLIIVPLVMKVLLLLLLYLQG